jgi:hypothetical protein
MKRFYLHVGLPRCASTTIERVFQNPEFTPYHRLIENGIKPLPRLYKEFRRAVGDPVWTDRHLGHFKDYHIEPARNDDARGFFVSDEGLTNVAEEKGAPVVYADRASFMGRLLEGFDTRIILVVRRQANFLVSLYSLHLQNTGTLEFGEFVDRLPPESLDWLRIADAYAEVFGPDKVVVVPLERSMYPDGEGYSDFFAKIQGTMELGNPVELSEIPVMNASLNPILFAAQMWINRTITPPEGAKLIHNILVENLPKDVSGSSPLSAESTQQLQARYADSNQELFSRYLPGFDPAPYMP